MNDHERGLYRLTSNQYYGGLRNRWDRRIKILRRCGFKYVKTEEGIAVFTRRRGLKQHRTIAASVLHNASNRSWFEYLSVLLRRF